MKIKSKQEFDLLALDKDELNGILLGLARVVNDDWLHDNIEYYGYGDLRESKISKLKKLIAQIERL